MQPARRSRRIAGMQPEAKDAPVIPALVVSKLLKSSRAVKMGRVKNLGTNGAPELKVEPNKANARVERPKTARGQKRTASTIVDIHISKAKEPKSSKGKEENNANEKEAPAKSAGRRKSRSSQPEAQGKKYDKSEKKCRAASKDASVPECVADIPRENEPSNIPTPNPGSIIVTDPDTDVPAPAAPAETEGGQGLDEEQTSSEISDELKNKR